MYRLYLYPKWGKSWQIGDPVVKLFFSPITSPCFVPSPQMRPVKCVKISQSCKCIANLDSLVIRVLYLLIVFFLFRAFLSVTFGVRPIRLWLHPSNVTRMLKSLHLQHIWFKIRIKWTFLLFALKGTDNYSSCTKDSSGKYLTQTTNKQSF